MDSGRRRVLDAFPYPVAYPYSLSFDESDVPSNRRWALCFTTYQLVRLVCLPLVSQYLRDAIDTNARDSVTALHRAIAAIRSPFSSKGPRRKRRGFSKEAVRYVGGICPPNPLTRMPFLPTASGGASWHDS